MSRRNRHPGGDWSTGIIVTLMVVLAVTLIAMIAFGVLSGEPS